MVLALRDSFLLLLPRSVKTTCLTVENVVLALRDSFLFLLPRSVKTTCLTSQVRQKVRSQPQHLEEAANVGDRCEYVAAPPTFPAASASAHPPAR